MPSFDVVSEVNMHEVTNALDQSNKELTNRFDLKGTGSKLERAENVVTLISDSTFHLDQVMQILRGKLAKREVNLKSLDLGDPVTSGKEVRQILTIQQGIPTELGKKIVKSIKDAKLKVQSSINEDKVRVTGKKRDDLQDVMALLKKAEFDLPLQFNNFRD